jgi:hypothetical protein
LGGLALFSYFTYRKDRKEIAWKKKQRTCTKSLLAGLLSPIGSLSSGFVAYDPADQPVLLYEVLFFHLASGLAILAKIVHSFPMVKAFWWPLQLIALLFIVLTLLILLFHLLVPPKFSASRLAQVIILLIWLLMITSI